MWRKYQRVPGAVTLSSSVAGSCTNRTGGTRPVSVPELLLLEDLSPPPSFPFLRLPILSPSSLHPPKTSFCGGWQWIWPPVGIPPSAAAFPVRPVSRCRCCTRCPTNGDVFPALQPCRHTWRFAAALLPTPNAFPDASCPSFDPL